jgi:hypothetical protein
MKEVDWLDDDGRWHRSGLPEGVSDTEAAIGVPLGPPSLEALGLPLAVEVRLHNQLHARRLFTARDLHRRLPDAQSAIASALRLDVQALEALYATNGAVESGPRG